VTVKIQEPTLAKLILDKTGMAMNHFARIHKMSKHSLISWNQPRTAATSRVPNSYSLLKLAGILDVSEQTIFDLCTRPNDAPVEW